MPEPNTTKGTTVRQMFITMLKHTKPIRKPY